MSFIEININNSFNEDANNTNREGFIGNDSTLNKNFDNSVEVNSINATSFTNYAANNQLGFTIENIKRKTLISEIFIAATGTVLASLITYIIMSFLR